MPSTFHRIARSKRRSLRACSGHESLGKHLESASHRQPSKADRLVPSRLASDSRPEGHLGVGRVAGVHLRIGHPRLRGLTQGPARTGPQGEPGPELVAARADLPADLNDLVAWAQDAGVGVRT